MGACFYLIVTLITVLFSMKQAHTWLNYKDTVFTTTTIQDYFDAESYSFTEADGLQLAFAITDRNIDAGTSSDYLEIEAGMISQFYKESSYEKLDVHDCTPADIEKFFPVKKSYEKTYEQQKSKLLCIDLSNIEIKGDANTPTNSQLIIQFKIPEI